MNGRLPRETLDALRAELLDWRPPSAFRSRVEEIVRPLPRRIFFGQAGLAFLRDAWIAGRFADVLSSHMVRLIPDERPDFEIQTAGQIQQFEVTEADMDGRRRGDEPDGPEIEADPVENWRKRFEAIPAALDRVVKKKLLKDYPPEVGLVIYVNLGCYGAYVSEGLPILRDGTRPAKEKFKVVFVMWEGTLYRFWEDGKYSFEKWQSAIAQDF
jgi:hypothetical protein